MPNTNKVKMRSPILGECKITLTDISYGVYSFKIKSPKGYYDIQQPTSSFRSSLETAEKEFIK